VRLEGLGQLKKSNDIIGKRTRDLPVCSIVPQSTAVQNITGTGSTLENAEKCIQGSSTKSCWTDVTWKIQEHTKDIKTVFEVTELRDMDWIHLDQGRDR
jgi:hypothetical protein